MGIHDEVKGPKKENILLWEARIHTMYGMNIFGIHNIMGIHTQ